MKRSLADKIEQYIKALIEHSYNNEIQIQRRELAETFGCAPSQITYVINSRFSQDKGYYTLSKKGGSGYIKIILSENTTYQEVLDIINNMFAGQQISSREFNLFNNLLENVVTLADPNQDEFMKNYLLILDKYFKEGLL